MERYICIHGHFYQPPRENAWREKVEWQNSAYPYHDWNERVTAECYLTNGSSRILDSEGYIDRIVNNYAKISFDYGPTLLVWLEENAPDVYQSVLDADKESQSNFSGHGSAMAQAYNHIIMPLANHHDRISQVIWGIRDFEHRFSRKPEGMWIPETAVDLETLDIMAEQGVKFTVLAPHQAGKVRRIGSEDWEDVPNASIDPTRAYNVVLPSGRQIAVFFYDGPISNAVAFEDILENGSAFANRLTSAFLDERDHAQLVHIADDGETYGHHKRFADMALAFALDEIDKGSEAKLTNYGEFLEKYPPEYEAEIIEKTSWSCIHGVDRWWSPCGEAAGAAAHQGWNQEWRTPLRNAMDWLRDTLVPLFEQKAQPLFKDPWAARDGYIDVILDRSPESTVKFLSKYAAHPLNENEQTVALKLMEMQRHAMLMYTSCGWFFDEISRPEPLQVMQYAARAIELAEELFGEKIEEEFLEILEKAESNIPEQGNGRRIYERLVKPLMPQGDIAGGFDEQRRMLEGMIDKALTGLDRSYLPLFERLYPPEKIAAELGSPVPPDYLAAEELIIDKELHGAVRSYPVDAVKIHNLLDTAAKWQITTDNASIAYELKYNLEKMIKELVAQPENLTRLQRVAEAVKLARSLPFPVDLWRVQNVFWEMKDKNYPAIKTKAESGDQTAQMWVKTFTALGKDLLIKAD